MKVNGLTRFVVGALTLVAVAGFSAQTAQADTYYRTYTSTSTWTEPTTVMLERPMTIERVVESPALIERVVSSPAMVERCVESPVLIEKTVEKPVIIEKEISRPVILQDRVLDDHLMKLDLFHLLKFGAL